MRNLFDFLRKYNYWILFVLLEVFSLFLLFRFNLYQGSVWFTSANVVSARILEAEASLLQYINLGYQNKALMQRNVVLEQRVHALAGQLARVTHDSTYMEQRQASMLNGFTMVEAEVINSTVKKKDNYITINKGEADGIKPEMGVVCGTGIVGIVYMTTPHNSIVLPLLNSRSNISCRLRETDYYGYLRWDGKHLLHASMGDVPRHARVKTGMKVETSGFSAVFPPGIFIGVVKKVENSDDGLSYKLDVNLSTDFARLSHVIVLTTPHKVEIDSLEQKLNLGE